MKRSICIIIVASLAGLYVLTGIASADISPAFSFQHEPPQGFTANERTPISVHLDASEGIEAVRLYFRPFLMSDYVYIELEAGTDGNYAGQLPALDTSVTGLEYLFVWKNSPRRVVRTAAYPLSQAGSGNGAKKSYPTALTVYTEIDGNQAVELNTLTTEAVIVQQVTDEDRHLGMRTGLYDMSADERYRYGLFGGFIYEPDENRTYPTKGYVNFQ
jgi:hypothetical protein